MARHLVSPAPVALAESTRVTRSPSLSSHASLSCPSLKRHVSLKLSWKAADRGECGGSARRALQVRAWTYPYEAKTETDALRVLDSCNSTSPCSMNAVVAFYSAAHKNDFLAAYRNHTNTINSNGKDVRLITIHGEANNLKNLAKSLEATGATTWTWRAVRNAKNYSMPYKKTDDANGLLTWMQDISNDLAT